MKFKYSKSFSIGIAGILAMLFLVWLGSISSCNNNTLEYKKSAPDSVRTWVLFTTPASWGLQEGMNIQFIDRKARDTTYFDTLNENTAKKMYKRDTSYWIYVSTFIMDSITKRAILDSLGRPKIRGTYIMQLPKENIKKDLNNYTP